MVPASSADPSSKQAAALYGAETVPDKPRTYAGKNKSAQEAHEAIRPSGETFRTPAELASALRGNDMRLYDLIWKRTVASQMADAKGQTASVTIEASVTEGDNSGTVAEFSASGTVITFRGFLQAYEEGRDEERNASTEPTEAKLPAIVVSRVVFFALGTLQLTFRRAVSKVSSSATKAPPVRSTRTWKTARIPIYRRGVFYERIK